MTTDTPEPPSPELQRRALLDLAARVKNAGLTYVVVWLVLTGLYGIAQTHTAMVAIVSALLFALGMGRIVMHARMPRLIEWNFTASRRAFRLLLLVHMGFWSGLTALAQHWLPLRPIEFYMLLVTATLVQGGVASMSFDRVLRFAFPTVGLAPVVLGAIVRADHSSIALILMCAVLFFYAMGASRAVRDDYWNAQLARAVAEDRAGQLERLSRTDALTQIPNRLFFDERMAVEWDRARREGRAISVATVDLDFSRRSTTPTVTHSAMCASRVRRRRCAPSSSAPQISSPGTAARSSSCCCPTLTLKALCGLPSGSPMPSVVLNCRQTGTPCS